MNDDLFQLLITLSICVLLPIVIVCVICLFKYKNNVALYDLYKIAIEKGVPIPAFPERNENKDKQVYGSLKGGIVLLFFGIALLILGFVSKDKFIIIALPFIFVGTGLILSFFLVRYYNNKNIEANK